MACCTCPLKAGHAGTIGGISHVLPDFNMLQDAFKNTYLGLCEGKDGNKSETIPLMFCFFIYTFLLEVGQQLV